MPRTRPPRAMQYPDGSWRPPWWTERTAQRSAELWLPDRNLDPHDQQPEPPQRRHLNHRRRHQRQRVRRPDAAPPTAELRNWRRARYLLNSARRQRARANRTRTPPLQHPVIRSLHATSWFTTQNVAVHHDDIRHRQPDLVQPNENQPPAVNSASKWELIPTIDQREKIHLICEAVRYVYNKIVQRYLADLNTELYRRLLTYEDQPGHPVDFDNAYDARADEIIGGVVQRIRDRMPHYRSIATKRSLRHDKHFVSKFGFALPGPAMETAALDFKSAFKSSNELYARKVDIWRETYIAGDRDPRPTFPIIKPKNRRATSISFIARHEYLHMQGSHLQVYHHYFRYRVTNGILISRQRRGTGLPQINHDCRIKRTRTGRFYLCVPTSKEFLQTCTGRTCAIDPGVRNFATIYDPSGVTVSITDANDAIQRRLDRIDELRSQMNVLKPERRYRVGRVGRATRDELRTSRRLSRMLYRLKYEELRLQERVKNMVHDMHHKVAKFLSEHYHQVLLPHFRTQGMVARSGVLSHRTRRMMLTQSHYKFKMILKEKMARTGGQVVDCDEWWTTR